jgi:hypothetical protein
MFKDPEKKNEGGVNDAFDSLGDDYMSQFGFKRDDNTWEYTEVKSKVPEVRRDDDGEIVEDPDDRSHEPIMENGHPKFQEKDGTPVINDQSILSMSHSRVESNGKTYEAVVAHRRFAVEDKNRFQEDLDFDGEDPPKRDSAFRNGESVPVWGLMSKSTPVCYPLYRSIAVPLDELQSNPFTEKGSTSRRIYPRIR